MLEPRIDMTAMPYFPGIVSGKLQTGAGSNDHRGIALIAQEEIRDIETVPAGLIVVEAAPFSHTMITLLGWGVPTVLVSADQAATLVDGMTLCVDGTTGRITENTESCRKSVTERPSPPTGRTVFERPGGTVELLASVRTPSAAQLAASNGARAVGLVRSEFVMPTDGSVPSVSFYRESFRSLCTAARPLPLTFRLLDVAADKRPAWLPSDETIGQALGLQGVRLYGTHPVDEVVERQIAALAELSEDYELRILIPFLVRVEEMMFWRDRVRAVLPRAVPVGAMAETIASVLDIEALLDVADFVAIGCNDLMQAVFSADRDQPRLRHYLDPYAPVLFRLFRQIAENAGNRCAQLQLCGVLPQITGVLPVLLGMGYRRFSVDAPFIPHLAQVVAETEHAECVRLAEAVCRARTTEEVLSILRIPGDRHAPYLD